MTEQRRIGCGGATLIGVATIAVAWFALRAGMPAESPPARHPSDGARGACMLFIKQQLRDPDSAQWGELGAWPVAADGPGQWAVAASYRAKNGFGGFNVERTRCVVKAEGANWRLVSLSK